MYSHRKGASLLSAACLVFAACGSGPTEPGGQVAPEPITELPRALTPTETTLVSASNRFGFSLLSALRAEDPAENLFVSPLSAHMALGMALVGAREDTEEAMRTVLGFASNGPPPSADDINASYAGMLDLLTTLDPTVEIRVANSVWYRPDFPFRSSYLDVVRTAFDAEVEALDFSLPTAPQTINDWVSGKTNGRITEMLESIDPMEVMFLLNAVYFKGNWTTRFDPDRTYDAPFHLEDGTTKTVRMMVREEGEFWAGRSDGVQLVDLPYGGAAFRMTILLPDEGVPLSEPLSRLDADTWAAWTATLQPSQAMVEMPRFELEWEKGLKDALEALGMGIAFQPGVADFGGMLADGYDPQASGTDLHITRVQHKSFVSVNEEGTEAAAATSVGIGVTSAPLPLTIDRPFLFAIRERLSGTVLFLGAVQDPPSS